MLAQRAILGGVNDDAFHQHLSGGVTDRNRDACLMHVHANILSVIHWVLLSVGHEPTPQAYLKGTPFFYNALTEQRHLLAKWGHTGRTGALGPCRDRPLTWPDPLAEQLLQGESLSLSTVRCPFG